MRFNFAVIGAGKVGRALVSILKDEGSTPAWVVSKKEIHGIETFPFLPSTPQKVTVVFICVPDSQIDEIVREMASKWKYLLKGICVYHMSGHLPSDILDEVKKYGAETASLHPLQSIVEETLAKAALKRSWFACEGTQKAVEQAELIVSKIGAGFVKIHKNHKALYHAAAVLASNYLVTLLSHAEDIGSLAGFDALHILPLVQGTVANYSRFGRKALTGPVQRGDWITVQEHIDALKKDMPDMLPSYLSLARDTARLAGRDFLNEINLHEKITHNEELTKRISVLKKRGMKTVFTNGCFDILHAGHVDYLQKAKDLGDVLILGLNSDASVKKLKGEERPVNSQDARAFVLAGLSSVDMICVFDEDTPLKLIKSVKPDVLVKGGDWDKGAIVGNDFVSSYGGKVLTIPFKDGFSTTKIINRLKK